MNVRRVVVGCLVLVVGAIVILAVPFSREARKATWFSSAASQIKQLHQVIIAATREDFPTPPSTFALVLSNYFSPQLLVVPGSGRDAGDILIGDKPWRDFGDINPDEFRVHLSHLPAQEWEPLGDFFLHRDIWVVAPDHQPKLVVGFSVECPWSPKSRVILFSDNSTEVVVGDAWLHAENERRGQLQLPALPPLP